MTRCGQRTRFNPLPLLISSPIRAETAGSIAEEIPKRAAERARASSVHFTHSSARVSGKCSGVSQLL